MKLNGWRRLALVLCTLWCAGNFTVFTYEVSTHHDGYFVGLFLPIGTVVSGDKARLPDGRTINLNITIGGKPIKPWEIKWSNEPEVPTEQHIFWNKLLLQAIAIPFGFWVCVELLFFVGNWVARGFRDREAP